MSKTQKKEAIVVPDAVTVTDPALKNMIDLVNGGKFTDAVEWIKKKAKEEEQTLQTGYVFDAYPVDGAVAFYNVLRRKYGWVEQMPIRSFFGDRPPQLVAVETVDGTIEVPWGEVRVPNIDGSLHVGAANKDGMWKAQIIAQVKKKDMAKAKELMELTKAELKVNSIYKGQAISLRWEEEEGSMFNAGSEGFGVPKFIQSSGFGKMDLILPEHIHGEVDATIFSLIENSAKARAMGIPTKRLVLLAGPYGVGKTLTATVTSELCRKYGRTFAYLRDVKHLADAVYFLQNYSPACVFGEDIDSVDEETMDEIANTIDGLDTKNIDMIFILTTNHPDRIPEKFLRAGRSDMVIRFTPPDAEAAARLILRYGASTLKATFEDALRVGEAMAEVQMIPASIREVVERSKLFALARGEETINIADLQRATHSVIAQLDLLKRTPLGLLPDSMESVGMLVRHKGGKAFVSIAESTLS